VQIIKNVPGQGGVLKLGTEVVVSADRSVSALLGASPGGSTSPAIMLSLLEKVFADRMKTDAWQSKIREIVPSYGKKLNEHPDLLAAEWAATAETLQLAIASPSLDNFAPSAAPAGQPGVVKKVPDIAL
jgi:malate dehydrogenase (quinone)